MNTPRPPSRKPPATPAIPTPNPVGRVIADATRHPFLSPVAERALADAIRPSQLVAQQAADAFRPAIRAHKAMLADLTRITAPTIRAAELTKVSMSTLPTGALFEAVAQTAATTRMFAEVMGPTLHAWQDAIASTNAAMANLTALSAAVGSLQRDVLSPLAAAQLSGAAAALRLAEHAVELGDTDHPAASGHDGDVLQYVLQRLAEILPEQWREYLRTPGGTLVVLGFLVAVYSAVVTTVKDSPPPTIVVQPPAVTVQAPDPAEFDRWVDEQVDERLQERGVLPDPE